LFNERIFGFLASRACFTFQPRVFSKIGAGPNPQGDSQSSGLWGTFRVSKRATFPRPGFLPLTMQLCGKVLKTTGSAIYPNFVETTGNRAPPCAVESGQ